MSEELPIWRQALKDSTHPLYSAAWLIFSEKMKLDAADKLLAERKAEIIPFLLDILRTPDLQLESSLGGGEAPINAVELLGHWNVPEAIPDFIGIVEEDDWETILHDRILVALEKMGPEIIEPLLASAEKLPPNSELHMTYAGILSQQPDRLMRASGII